MSSVEKEMTLNSALSFGTCQKNTHKIFVVLYICLLYCRIIQDVVYAAERVRVVRIRDVAATKHRESI